MTHDASHTTGPSITTPPPLSDAPSGTKPRKVRIRPSNGAPDGWRHERRKRRDREMLAFERPEDAVGMGADGAAAVLGCDRDTVNKLSHYRALHLVPGRPPGKGQKGDHTILLRPGADLAAVYAGWCARVRVWNHRTAIAHGSVRRSCGIPDDHPMPEGLDAFAAETFGRIGRSEEEEVAAFYRVPERSTVDRDRIRAILLASGAAFRTMHGTPSIGPALAVLAHPTLAQLPDTCLDPSSEEAEAPGGTVLGRALSAGTLAGAATWFALVASASARPDRQLLHYMTAFASVARRMEALGHAAPTGQALQAALTSMLDEADRRGPHWSTIVRHCGKYIAATRMLRAYLHAQGDEVAARLRPLMPQEPYGLASIRKRVARATKRMKAQHVENRKRSTDVAAERITAHIRAERFRMEQVLAVGLDAIVAEAALAAHVARRDALSETERAATPAFHEYIVTMPVLDERGDLVPGVAQECIFWAWRERDAWLSLEHGALRRQRGMSVCKRRSSTLAERARLDVVPAVKFRDVKSSPEKYDNIVHEYRGCRPVEEDGSCREPWFVTIDRLGAEAAPSNTTARRQRRRHRLIQTWGLKRGTRSCSGLLTPAGDGGMLFNWMASRNRTMVAVLERYHAYGFADLLFSLIIETLCRGGEALQVSQEPECWTEDGVAPAAVAFLARIKGAGQDGALLNFEVTEQLFASVMAWADTAAVAQDHVDGWLPRIPADRDIRGRRPDDGAWVFQWLGRAIRLTEVGGWLSSLMANRGHITPHVLRHAAANLLREAGVPERVIQAILRHRSILMTLMYARATLSQARRAAKIAVRTGREAAADRLGQPTIDPSN